MVSRESFDSPGLSGGHAFVLLATLIVVFAVFFFDTASSLWDIWISDGTYSHGLLIIPASVWFVWRERRSLVSIEFSPNALSLLIVLIFGCVWIIAAVSKVNLVSQGALVAMVIVSFWSLAGTKVSSKLFLPLMLLFLAVPFGEFAEPFLMRMTADFTVWMVQLSGIPVYREGLFFELPTGSWSVVKACSGSRYLYASLTLGSVYALLYLNESKHRLLLIGFSCITPLFANLLRAYGIVMIGHHSGMELATGVDHLIYGWIFFGIVALIIFWFGAYLARRELPDFSVGKHVVESDHPSPRFQKFAVAVVAIVAIAASCRLLYAYAMYTDTVSPPPERLLNDGWVVTSLPQELTSPKSAFVPSSRGNETINFLRGGGEAKEVLLNIQSVKDNSEVIGGINNLKLPDSWRFSSPVGESLSYSYCGSESVPVFWVRSLKSGVEFVVARLYTVGGKVFASDLGAKVSALLVRFRLAEGEPLLVTVSANAAETSAPELVELLCDVATELK